MGAARYTYQRLLEKGIIKRITITMTRLPIKYNAVFLMEISNGVEFYKSRKDFLLEIINESENIPNKYAGVGEIGTPDGCILIMPIFKDSEFQEVQKEIESNVKGVEIENLVVTNVVVGSLCYRRFDNDYSSQYRILSEEYKILPQKERTKYT